MIFHPFHGHTKIDNTEATTANPVPQPIPLMNSEILQYELRLLLPKKTWNQTTYQTLHTEFFKVGNALILAQRSIRER